MVSQSHPHSIKEINRISSKLSSPYKVLEYKELLISKIIDRNIANRAISTHIQGKHKI